MTGTPAAGTNNPTGSSTRAAATGANAVTGNASPTTGRAKSAHGAAWLRPVTSSYDRGRHTGRGTVKTSPGVEKES